MKKPFQAVIINCNLYRKKNIREFKMALVDIIKHEAPDDTLFVWKHPSSQIKVGSQLVVGEGQQAIFVKGGQALDCFDPGTHTLITGNIPLLDKIINLPFGGDTPFTAEVWFVNTTVKRDLKWGTPNPIPLMDTALGFPVSVRAFGKWGAKITDVRSFVMQIVGTQSHADAEKVHSYFIGKIIESLTTFLGRTIASGEASILQIASVFSGLSDAAATEIMIEFEKFGVELVNFDIESINLPNEEMEKIQAVFAKTLEAKELSKTNIGGAYTAIKSFEVLNNAATNQNDGTVGAMLGAGIGLGAGLPIGGQIGQQINIPATPTADSIGEKLRQLKILLDDGLITQEQFDEKRNKLIEDL